MNPYFIAELISVAVLLASSIATLLQSVPLEKSGVWKTVKIFELLSLVASVVLYLFVSPAALHHSLNSLDGSFVMISFFVSLSVVLVAWFIIEVRSVILEKFAIWKIVIILRLISFAVLLAKYFYNTETQVSDLGQSASSISVVQPPSIYTLLVGIIFIISWAALQFRSVRIENSKIWKGVKIIRLLAMIVLSAFMMLIGISRYLFL